MHASRLVNAEIIIEAREDSGQDKSWRASHEMLRVVPQRTVDKDVYFRASSILIPAIWREAQAQGIVLMSPHAKEQVLSGDIGEPDLNGWYRIDFVVRFYTESLSWEEASVWLHTALESVQHPDIHVLSISESKAFFS